MTKTYIVICRYELPRSGFFVNKRMDTVEVEASSVQGAINIAKGYISIPRSASNVRWETRLASLKD